MRTKQERDKATAAHATKLAETPTVTVEILEAAVVGKSLPPLVKWDGNMKVSGHDALRVFRHAPTSKLVTMESEKVKSWGLQE